MFVLLFHISDGTIALETGIVSITDIPFIVVNDN